MARIKNDQICLELTEDLPIASQIYEYLKNAIIECRYKPHDRVSENDIAALFNISRQPVREALIRLANNDFVLICPKKATRVMCISKEHVRQGCEIRVALESHAAQRAIDNITDNYLERLKDNHKKQLLAAKNSDLREHFRLDDDFHRLIIDIAGLSQMWNIVEGLKGAMDRVRYLSIEQEVTPIYQTCYFHKNIIDAIERRDRTLASEAVRRHIVNTWESLAKVMDQSSLSYFTD